jgi:hypothetical protein
VASSWFTDSKTPSPFEGDHNDFQPRVGFAYALNAKTSIRAGYGLFYTLSRATLKGTLGAGFTSQSSVEWSRYSNITRYAKLSNPYPDGLNLPPGRSLGPMTFIGLGASTIVRENIKPSYNIWNFSIQRQLTGSSLIEVNYTGTKGSHQYVPYTSLSNLDPVFWGIGRTELNRLVPNPFYGVITDPRSPLSTETFQRYRLYRPYPQYNGASRGGAEPPMGDTIYHSMQIKFERRFSRGLSVLAHYTISKAIDDVADGSSSWDWPGGSASMQYMFNLRNERSLSISDVPQRLVMTFSYECPSAPVKRWEMVGAGSRTRWPVAGRSAAS